MAFASFSGLLLPLAPLFHPPQVSYASFLCSLWAPVHSLGLVCCSALQLCLGTVCSGLTSSQRSRPAVLAICFLDLSAGMSHRHLPFNMSQTELISFSCVPVLSVLPNQCFLSLTSTTIRSCACVNWEPRLALPSLLRSSSDSDDAEQPWRLLFFLSHCPALHLSSLCGHFSPCPDARGWG